MPPHPVGISPGSPTRVELEQSPTRDDASTRDWYDRSSLDGDFMVMIAGQTEADWLRRAPDSLICEFIDGIVYMPPRVHAEHGSDSQFLYFLIAGFFARRPVGLVYLAPVALKLREGCLLEPDLFILPPDGKTRIVDGVCYPPVLVAVEVLSPSNRRYDLDQKAAIYREAAVAELWFVDARDRVVIVERLEGGNHRSERIESGPVVSRAIPGLWFDAAWLWANPEPNLLDCLDQILAGPPRG